MPRELIDTPEAAYVRARQDAHRARLKVAAVAVRATVSRAAALRLLGLASEDEHIWLEMTNAERKRRAQEAVQALLDGLGADAS